MPDWNGGRQPRQLTVIGAQKPSVTRLMSI